MGNDGRNVVLVTLYGSTWKPPSFHLVSRGLVSSRSVRRTLHKGSCNVSGSVKRRETTHCIRIHPLSRIARMRAARLQTMHINSKSPADSARGVLPMYQIQRDIETRFTVFEYLTVSNCAHARRAHSIPISRGIVRRTLHEGSCQCFKLSATLGGVQYIAPFSYPSRAAAQLVGRARRFQPCHCLPSATKSARRTSG